MGSPAVVHELRRLDTMPYDELPKVVFKEEVKFLYDDRERLRRQLERQEETHKLKLRGIKLGLAHLRDAAMRHRNYVVTTKSVNQQGYEELINILNGLVRSIKI